MNDAKVERVLAEWHRLAVTQGLTGRWTAQIVVRDGQVVSVQTTQNFAPTGMLAKLDDARNSQAFQAILDWVRACVCDSARVVIYADYTNGVTSAQRCHAGVIVSVG